MLKGLYCDCIFLYFHYFSLYFHSICLSLTCIYFSLIISLVLAHSFYGYHMDIVQTYAYISLYKLDSIKLGFLLLK